MVKTTLSGVLNATWRGLHAADRVIPIYRMRSPYKITLWRKATCKNSSFLFNDRFHKSIRLDSGRRPKQKRFGPPLYNKCCWTFTVNYNNKLQNHIRSRQAVTYFTTVYSSSFVIVRRSYNEVVLGFVPLSSWSSRKQGW